MGGLKHGRHLAKACRLHTTLAPAACAYHACSRTRQAQEGKKDGRQAQEASSRGKDKRQMRPRPCTAQALATAPLLLGAVHGPDAA